MNRKTRAAAVVHIIVQALVFVMFSVLAINSLRGISVLDSRVSNVTNSLARLDDRTNDTDYYHRIEYDTLAQRAQDLQRESQDLQHTLYNETSLVFPRLIKQAMPSVVGVTNSSNPAGCVNGSGFVIDAANGYIMTAKHVVGRVLPDFNGKSVQYEIELTCGDRIAVKRIYKYTKDDLAILVVDTYDPNYCLVSEFSISEIQPKRGDIVVVLGNPFSFLFSASAGIVSNPQSAHYRGWPSDEFTERIQYDAMSNPGGSGCAVVNIYGEVIGVYVTGKWVVRQNSGVSFAVPARAINDCIDQFKLQQSTGIIESEDI